MTPIDQCSLLDLYWDGFKEGYEKPKAERHGEKGMYNDQSKTGIVETSVHQQNEKGNEEQYLGNHIGEQYRTGKDGLSSKMEAADAISAKRRDQDGDDNGTPGHDGAVDEVLDKTSLLPDHDDVLEGEGIGE